MRNHRLWRAFLILGLLFTSYKLLITNCSAEEALTITTYYPSPYGVYNELRLYPHSPPTDCTADQIGLMYYNSEDHNLRVCRYNGSAYAWEPVSGGYWAASPANPDNIYNTNTGRVGIGTTNVPSKLTLVGSGYVDTAMNTGPSQPGVFSIKDATPQINFDDTDNNDWAIHVNSNKMYFIREPWNYQDLVLDGAGRVGIGTDNPGDKLTVHLGTNVNLGLTTGTYPVLASHNDDWNAWGNLQLNNSMYLIGSTSNVGIGTTEPLQPLQVGALTGVSDGQIVVAKSNNGPNRAFRLGLDDNYNFSLGDYGYNGANAYSPYLTVRYGTGNVGIGTPYPSAKLQIVKEGDAMQNEWWDGHPLAIWGNDQYLGIGVDTTRRTAYFQSIDVGTQVSNIALNPLGGNVGIGIPIPTWPLDVAAVQGKVCNYVAWSYTNPVVWNDGCSGTVALSIHAKGRIVTEDEFNILSDQRLKNFVGDIKPDASLDAITQLKPLRFKWKPDVNSNDRVQAGFFAQQVAEVIPEAVTVLPGKHFQDEYLLNHDTLGTYAISAIQGLKVKTDSLEQRVEA